MIKKRKFNIDMEAEKENKLYEMLEYMRDFSLEQPKAIQKLCKDLFISPSYAPVIDLLVESFLTVYSFSILMFEGLISNASAILRILIEQVSSIVVISNNPNVMSNYIAFYNKKKNYYGSTREEHIKYRDKLIKECGHCSEYDIKKYLDYGWIRILNKDKTQRSSTIIIKEAHLEEMIFDINEHLNAFAHGKRSIFDYANKKDLVDMHISRIIMAAGKMFLLLCHSKQELLVQETIDYDKNFESYINAKLLFLDLNARATNKNIVAFIKNNSNGENQIHYTLSTLDHMRGLIYSTHLDDAQVNLLAKSYVFQLKNLSILILIKKLNFQNLDDLLNLKSYKDIINVFGYDNVLTLYNKCECSINFNSFIEMVDSIDENWVLIKNAHKFSELDELFLTNFTTFDHCIYEDLFPNKSINELLDSFIPID